MSSAKCLPFCLGLNVLMDMNEPDMIFVINDSSMTQPHVGNKSLSKQILKYNWLYA